MIVFRSLAIAAIATAVALAKPAAVIEDVLFHQQAGLGIWATYPVNVEPLRVPVARIVVVEDIAPERDVGHECL